jgi:hypothetical protein
VPQVPNDEPASVLLERIAAARARHAAEVKRKPRRKVAGKGARSRRARPDARQ